MINGSKLWNSGADTADFGIVYVRTDPEKGRQGITAFLIDTDTPGFRVERLVQVLRAHYTTELSFTDMRVPHANILGEEGGGFSLANEQLAANRIPYSAACLGVAQYAHEMAIDWAKQRETFGQPLANRQAIQWMLVDNEIDLRTGRWACLDAADKAERGQPFASSHRWPNSSARRALAASSIAACRSSAGSACRRTCRSSAGTASCVSAASAKAHPRSSAS